MTTMRILGRRSMRRRLIRNYKWNKNKQQGNRLVLRNSILMRIKDNKYKHKHKYIHKYKIYRPIMNNLKIIKKMVINIIQTKCLSMEVQIPTYRAHPIKNQSTRTKTRSISITVATRVTNRNRSSQR